jgi:chloramphenicol O-acetyltransferase type A
MYFCTIVTYNPRHNFGIKPRVIDLQTGEAKPEIQTLATRTSICANVINTFLLSQAAVVTVAIVYLIARTANEIPACIHSDRCAELRLSIAPSSRRAICLSAPFSLRNFRIQRPRPGRSLIKRHPTLKDEPGNDNLLFMSAIPWVSFTSFMHPIHLHPVDSVPRFAWGKFFEQGGRLLMPLSVQAHHALLDGLHVGR